MIKATLNILGRNYKAEGKSVRDVLNKLKPPVVKSKGILTLEKGKGKTKITKERVLTHVVVNGVFGVASGTVKEIRVKNLEALFGEF